MINIFNKELLLKEVNKLNAMLEDINNRNSEEVLKQSQKVDKLIVEYMRERGDMKLVEEIINKNK